MNRALFWQSIRSLLGSMPRMLIAMAATFLPVTQQALAADSALALPDPLYVIPPLIAMTCAQDARSGLQRAILGRPVERWRYLVTRFAAAWMLTTALLGLAIVASHGVALFVDAEARLRPDVLAWQLVLLAAACAPMVAFFVAGSAILPPLGDVVALVVSLFGYVFLLEFRPIGWEVMISPLFILKNLLMQPSGFHPAATILVFLANAGALLGIGVLVFARQQIPGEARA